ncbi:acetyl-CoA carboxylase biotin carboxyl carrier protein subunit [Thermonema rossianum]|jgi:acetyl/propionyl-CoA carboxylase alpha subunit|uniref:acetyl-CoA carboxylase biotin carboxyl carrier protein subunit n=1 Tax=Thermonema rossianum TaxID=55505 RepID=UPI0009FCC0B6|nr:acetyl-CoA carboxylase biotin carboxyl carrier protein subunit [Thermonema rossianum]
MKLTLRLLNTDEFSELPAAAEGIEVESKDKQLLLNGVAQSIDIRPLDARRFHLIAGQRSYTVEVLEINKTEKSITLLMNGKTLRWGIQEPIDLLLKEMGIDQAAALQAEDLKAPMPGLVLDIKVSVGQEVKKGDALLILEAMKMENVLKAPADAKVKNICIEKGQGVEKNQVLIEFE